MSWNVVLIARVVSPPELWAVRATGGDNVDASHIDAIQTAGIIFIGIMVAYAVVRLELTIRQALAELKLMLIAQKQTFDGQSQIDAAIADVARRLAELESRLEKPKAQPRPRKPKPPPVNVSWMNGTK